MSLSFESTGIAKLDHLLYVMEEASHYVHDSTRWDELDWRLILKVRILWNLLILLYKI